MRPLHQSLSLSVALSLLLAPAPIAFAQDADDANARARARAEWYNEGYGRNERVPARPLPSEGLWSAAFRRFMLEAAERERQKWGALIPGHADMSQVLDPRDRAEARGGASWLNIGPTKANFLTNGPITVAATDAGRVRSFAIHPSDASTLYVAFSGGGVWKTVNGGVSWTALTEGVGSLSVGWLAMDPANPNTLYLGLGDPFDGTGIGLVKSTNGGTTWSAPVFLGNSTIINQVLVSPAASNVVLAGTNAGLFRSTDSGATFNVVPIATGQAVQPYVWSIASTGGTGLVLSLEADIAGAGTGQVWFSIDNGATWTRSVNVEKAGGVERITVASAPSSPNIVYAMATSGSGGLAEIFRSTTGGMFFRGLRAPQKRFTNPTPDASGPSSASFFNGQGAYDQMLIVDPADPDHFFFGGAQKTAESRGGGSSYRLVSDWLGRFSLPYVHADAHAAAYDAAGNLYFGTDGGIFKSSDNGVTFTDTLNVGITTHLVYHLSSSTLNRSMVIGGMQDNGTRVREGSGTIYNQTLGGDGLGCDIKSSNPTQVLGTVQMLFMRKSTDGGQTFFQACNGLPCGSGPFLSRVVPWTGSATGDVVFTHSNTVMFKTSDYAGSWAAVGVNVVLGGAVRNINVAHTSQSILGAVASGERVLLSANNGASWTNVSAGMPDNGGSLSHVQFDRVDPDIVYVASVVPDAAAAHLWKSTNFGTSWTRIDGGGFPTGVPVNVVRTDPANPSIVYAGTHLGVYRSADGGTTWVRYGSGMPLVEVTDLYIAPDNSIVRASTFGRGFWELVP